MDKKVLRLIIITLIFAIITIGLVIFKLVGSKEKNEPQPVEVAEEQPQQELEALPIDDPVGEDGMKIHLSENGYSVKYPSNMTAKSMAKAVDFILEDDQSGSSLNIVTGKNDGSISKLTKEEFEHSLMHTSEETVLLSYEEIMLNGMEAVVAEYIYLENSVKQIIIMTEEYGYNITVMESPYISQEMSEVFWQVVNSFVLN